MKKTAVILTLCMLVLVSCGKADVVEDSNPLNIQKATVNTTTTNEREEYKSPFGNSRSESSEVQITTPAETTVLENDIPVTTVRTGSAVLVKRTGVIPPSRGNVVIPYASNVVHVTKTTAINTTIAKKTTVTKTMAQATSTTVVTTMATENPADVTNGDITCRVQENGVEIIRDGKTIQLIEINTEEMLYFYAESITDPSTLINIEDFDFDGYDDLFIPQNIGTLNTNGVYMHYNPETETFEEWEAMSEIKTYIFLDKENQKLKTSVRESASDHEGWTYIWNDNKQLELVESWLQYAVDGNIFVDYYEYPNGEKNLLRREQHIYDEDGHFVKTIEVPLEEETTEASTEAPTEVPTEAPTEETTE